MKNIEETAGYREITVLIVLNGIEESEFLVQQQELLKFSKENLTVVLSKPGLVNARNAALVLVETDLITFFDDDIAIPTSYFKELDRFMASSSYVYGCAPRVQGYDPNSSLKLFPPFLKKTREKNFGKLTKSGLNIWIPDDDAYESIKVDWLPGCAMTYRTKLISGMQFDSALMNGPTKGYSLGEDVEFSSRVANLYSIPTLAINHLYATSVRDMKKVMAEANGRWLAYLSRNRKTLVYIKNILVRLFLSFLKGILEDAVKLDFKFTRASMRITQLKYFLIELKDPKLKLQ
jgi:GT2 family glycosyltransferase